MKKKIIINDYKNKNKNENNFNFEIEINNNNNNNLNINEIKNFQLDFNENNILFNLICFYNEKNDEFNIAIEIPENNNNNNDIISLLSKIKIAELNFESKIAFNCISLKTKKK
jgi:hypothetical protein